MDILTIVVISLVLLVFLWAWFCFMKEAFKDLQHIIIMLKARKILRRMPKEERFKFLESIHAEQNPNNFYMNCLRDDELKEFLKDK